MLVRVIFFHIIILQQSKLFTSQSRNMHAPTNQPTNQHCLSNINAEERCDDQMNINTRATTAAFLF